MILKKVDSIVECRSLIIRTALFLRGVKLSVEEIDNCLNNNIFSDLTREEIMDISNYNSIVMFMEEARRGGAVGLVGRVALSIALLMKLSNVVDKPFLADDVYPMNFERDMDKIFAEVINIDDEDTALKVLNRRLKKCALLREDNITFRYLILAIYMVLLKSYVPLADDSIDDVNQCVEEFDDFCNSLGEK